MDRDKAAGKGTSGRARQEADSSPALDEFLNQLASESQVRRPKPGQESVAAAMQAIQRLAVELDAEDTAVPTTTNGGRTCAACGASNREQNRFCSSCGVPLDSVPLQDQAEAAPTPATAPMLAPGDHHYHHHYHHHYFSYGEGLAAAPAASSPTAAGARIRAPLTGPSLSRAEAALRKTTQDLALACNTKQLEDAVSLYTTDALVLRPNVPPIRGVAAIREFYFSALDTGLGEVEMEPVRVELFGDYAYEAGRCKMLVPSALGKRREERGKYLIIYSRQTSDWRIMADCWSSDLSLTENPVMEAPKPGRKST